MAKVYLFLAEGFEDIEALAPVDILRRAGIDVKTVSVSGDPFVESAHGVMMQADLLFEDAKLDDADFLVLPGGLPGATNLNEHEGLRKALTQQAASGRGVAAICAAPMVLGSLGLLKGKRATCYPGFEKHLDGADYTAEICTVDGNVVTGEGPAASFAFGYAILEKLAGKQPVEQLKEGMRYKHLMEG